MSVRKESGISQDLGWEEVAWAGRFKEKGGDRLTVKWKNAALETQGLWVYPVSASYFCLALVKRETPFLRLGLNLLPALNPEILARSWQERKAMPGLRREERHKDTLHSLAQGHFLGKKENWPRDRRNGL